MENDKAAFVKLLLAAKHQQDLPIYIVLTMRSDYLGDCAQFWDLPEAINDCQYLELNAHRLIDISHESLIRNWKKLREWVEQEAQGARLYKRLADAPVDYSKGESGLWRDPELQIALKWREELRPNKPWARRYHPEFEAVIAFLRKSEQKQADEIAEQERQRQMEIERAHREAEHARALAEAQQQRAEAERQRAEEQTKATRFRRLSAALVGLFSLALIAAGLAFYAKRDAEAQRRIAVEQRQKAEEKEQTARQLNYVANINLAQAALAAGT